MAGASGGVPAEVLGGDTADVYFHRARQVLEREGLNPVVVMEVFAGRAGVLCGVEECVELFRQVLPPGSEVWGLHEGNDVAEREVVLRIRAPFQSFVLYETAYLGYLAQPSGWATAARECVGAAAGVPVISFGARHVHPAVAAVLEHAAFVGGCSGCATPAGARRAGKQPSGTMAHAMVLIFGDTVRAAEAFDRWIEAEVPRVALVDTFKDEAEESLRVAAALGQRLAAVRLDTPVERGRVTPALVKEVRARLDQAGYPWVKVFVSGGVSPQRIREFLEAGAPVDGFGVGSYISAAPPIDFTADLHEIDGRPVAKRGRIPGLTPAPRLQRLL